MDLIPDFQWSPCKSCINEDNVLLILGGSIASHPPISTDELFVEMVIATECFDPDDSNSEPFRYNLVVDFDSPDKLFIPRNDYCLEKIKRCVILQADNPVRAVGEFIKETFNSVTHEEYRLSALAFFLLAVTLTKVRSYQKPFHFNYPEAPEDNQLDLPLSPKPKQE